MFPSSVPHRRTSRLSSWYHHVALGPLPVTMWLDSIHIGLMSNVIAPFMMFRDRFRKVVLDFDRFVVSSGSVSRETNGEVSHPDPRHLVLRVTVYAHNEYKKYSQISGGATTFSLCLKCL